MVASFSVTKPGSKLVGKLNWIVESRSCHVFIHKDTIVSICFGFNLNTLKSPSLPNIDSSILGQE